jgi:hypothetical protein
MIFFIVSPALLTYSAPDATRNLKYVRALALAWPDQEFVQRPAAQLPWFQVCPLLEKVKDTAHRDCYVGTALEHGWSRGVAKPMGVAEYQLLLHVPESLERGLPSIDRIEAELKAALPDAQRHGIPTRPWWLFLASWCKRRTFLIRA